MSERRKLSDRRKKIVSEKEGNRRKGRGKEGTVRSEWGGNARGNGNRGRKAEEVKEAKTVARRSKVTKGKEGRDGGRKLRKR